MPIPPWRDDRRQPGGAGAADMTVVFERVGTDSHARRCREAVGDAVPGAGRDGSGKMPAPGFLVAASADRACIATAMRIIAGT